jgi:hypothetical protein
MGPEGLSDAEDLLTQAALSGQYDDESVESSLEAVQEQISCINPKVAPNAFEGIERYSMFAILKWANAEKGKSAGNIKKRAYTLIPYLMKDAEGNDELVYYAALRNGPDEKDYIVGPASRDKFLQDIEKYQKSADDEVVPQADDLIDEYDSLLNLDEEALGARLLKIALRQTSKSYALVHRVLDKISDSDRDDVSLAFTETASDENLRSFNANPSGSSLLDRVYEELVGKGGYATDEETAQGRRIENARASSITIEAFEEQSTKETLIFPFRPGGITVWDDAPIFAKRLGNGSVHVEMPTRVLGTKAFRAQTKTLPTEVFTSGIELPPTQIVGVMNYDDEGRVEYLPALSLIGYSGKGTTRTYENILSIASLATAGVGSAAVAGRVAWSARALLWIERAAVAADVIGIVVRDHRRWILQTFPEGGRDFIRATEVVTSAIAIFGFAALAAGGLKMFLNLRKAKAKFLAEARRLDLEAEELANVKRIEDSAGKLETSLNKARESQGLKALPPGPEPPKALPAGPEPPKALPPGPEPPKALPPGPERPKALPPGAEPRKASPPEKGARAGRIDDTAEAAGTTEDTAKTAGKTEDAATAADKAEESVKSTRKASDTAKPSKQYKHTIVDGKSAITDGKYTTSPTGMARHKPGTAPKGRSVFRSDVDAEKATLDAARYADEHGLWNAQNKAKVKIFNGPVGFLGDGTPTSTINVYRNKKGMIHGSPGSKI